MVLLGADRVDILSNLAEIDRHTFERHVTRFDQVVVEIRVAQIERVRRAGHACAVVVPVQQIERRRLFAKQVIVDHVAPDQIVGAQHVEHGRHVTAVEIAALHHLLLHVRHLRFVDEHRGVAHFAEVLQGNQERGCIHRSVTRGCQIRQRHAQQRATNAVADRSDLGRASDVFDGVERGERT